MTERLPICDTCGLPIQPLDARYSIADNPEKNTGRHWDCHTPMEQVLGSVRETLTRAEASMRGLRETLRGRGKD